MTDNKQPHQPVSHDDNTRRAIFADLPKNPKPDSNIEHCDGASCKTPVKGNQK